MLEGRLERAKQFAKKGKSWMGLWSGNGAYRLGGGVDGENFVGWDVEGKRPFFPSNTPSNFLRAVIGEMWMDGLVCHFFGKCVGARASHSGIISCHGINTNVGF